MSEFVLQPDEKVLEDERDVVWIKSWLAKVRGRLCFTTQRLVFVVDKPPALTAGALIANEMRNAIPVDIPRDALEKVEQGTYRKSAEVVVVKTENETCKFLVKSFKTWDARLRQAMHDDKIALEHLLARLAPKEKPPPYR